ncbi:MAG: fibronectin type III domain-containing protein [Bacteroidota bacterium]|nr:fibronectin type III domain-containing protein [Bacteroidota bacterium]
MSKDHVVLDFLRLSVIEKVGFGNSVVSSMTGSSVFTNPDVSLATVNAKNDLLESRFEASQKGGREETKLMHQAEDEWDEVMRKTALYVDRIADGDGALILNAGFNLAKKRAPGQRAEFVTENDDKSGTVQLRRAAVDGATAYIWQYAKEPLPADDSGWTTGATTAKASAAIAGLTPLTRYWFRVAAVTRQGTSAYTGPVMLAVV